MTNTVPIIRILGKARISNPTRYQFEPRVGALAERCETLAATVTLSHHHKNIASLVENARDYGVQISPLSQLFSFPPTQAYAIAAAACLQRTESKSGFQRSFPIGRKIGFTNRNIWKEYNINGPIWGYMYSTTCKDWKFDEPESKPFRLMTTFLEPKIEPEIVFGISNVPNSSMSDEALLNCVSWIGHGFEVVDSLYPAWKFNSGDAIIAGALHRCLLLDRRQVRYLSAFSSQTELLTQLENFQIDLYCNAKLVDSGRGSNVLGGPISALRFLVKLLEEQSLHPNIQPGEIITTGTLTKALPISNDDEWHTEIRGIDLPGYRTRFKFTDRVLQMRFEGPQPIRHVAPSQKS